MWLGGARGWLSHRLELEKLLCSQIRPIFCVFDQSCQNRQIMSLFNRVFFQQLKRGRIDSNEGISPRASHFNRRPGPGGGELTPQQHASFHNRNNRVFTFCSTK